MWAQRAIVMALFLFGAAHAAEFEGIAPIGFAGESAAREDAIADALDNARLAAGAHVQSSALQNVTGKSADALSVRGSAIGEYRVLSEWQANGFYHVKLDVQPAPPPVLTDAKKSASAQPKTCKPIYRSKALMTRIQVLHPAQANDLNAFGEELQSELMRRMDASSRFITQRSGNEMAMQLASNQTEASWDPEWIRQLARRYSVQFIIGGVVRDTAFEGERYDLTHGTEVREGERKSTLGIPGISFTQFGFKATPKARYFEMDISVFDGVSGARIATERLQGRVEGEVSMPKNSRFASARFFATDYGQLVDNKLNEAVQWADKSLACIPFSARITRVENGRLYLDAGATSRLQPGDRLQVFRLKPSAYAISPISFSEPSTLGWPEEIAGTVTLLAVQPLFSIAIPEGALRAEVGDYIRFVGGQESTQ